jgi:hypothetical protein
MIGRRYDAISGAEENATGVIWGWVADRPIGNGRIDKLDSTIGVGQIERQGGRLTGQPHRGSRRCGEGQAMQCKCCRATYA